MKNHPTRLQLEEFVSGDCGFLKSLSLRWHLRRCKECRDLCQEIKAERQEQLAFAAEVKRYAEASVQTEETLKTCTLSAQTPPHPKEP